MNKGPLVSVRSCELRLLRSRPRPSRARNLLLLLGFIAAALAFGWALARGFQVQWALDKGRLVSSAERERQAQ